MSRPRRRKPKTRNTELSALATPEYAALQQEYDESLSVLTELQRRFVVTYLATGELHNSMREAGYNVTNAKVVGNKILRTVVVMSALDAGRKLFAEKYRVKAQDLIEELKLIAHYDPTEYHLDAEGKAIKLPGQAYKWRAVSSIKRRIVPRKDAPPEIHEEIRFHPKLDAIRLLGQHLGLLGGEGAEDQVRPPSITVSGVDPARVAGLPAPALPAPAPEIIDVEVFAPGQPDRAEQ